MRSKPWHNRIGNRASCDRCGAVSIYIFMANWYDIGRHFLYWKWWKEFKKAHRNCHEKSRSLRNN